MSQRALGDAASAPNWSHQDGLNAQREAHASTTLENRTDRVSPVAFGSALQNASVAMAALSLDGRFLAVNPAFRAFLGYGEGELLGENHRELVDPEYRGRADAGLKQVLGGNAPFYHGEYPYRRRNGDVEWAHLTCSLIRDSTGAASYALLHIQRVLPPQTEAALVEARRLRAILEAGTEGLAVLGPDGIVSYAVPCIEKITGFRPVDLVGKPGLSFVHPDDIPAALAALAECLEEPEKAVRLEARIRCSDGSTRFVEISGRNLTHRPEVRGVVVGFRNITDQMKREAALRQSEDEFRGAFEDASIGMALTGLDGRFIRVNRALAEMLGYTVEQVNGRPIREISHPDDIQTGVEMLRRLVSGEVDHTRQEKRYFHADGHIIYCITTVSLIRSADGKPIHFVVQKQDITDLKMAEHILKRYELLAEVTTDVIFFFGPDGHIVDVNAAAVRAYGYSRDEFLGMNVTDLQVSEGDQSQCLSPATDRPVTYEAVSQRKNGDTFPIEVTLQSMDIQGHRLYLAVARDISDRKVAQEQLVHQAFHDTLTGLPNRALLMDRLEHALAKSARSGDNLAVLFLDLDRFKTVNDSLGHEAGDELLLGVAGRLRGCVRTEDTVARLGGDEFVILLESVPDDGEVTRLADRIKRRLLEAFEIAGQEVFVTASIGVVVPDKEHRTAESFLRDADLAMYQAKAAGRGRYVIFQSAMSMAAHETLCFETELRQAIKRNEFQVYYQPIVRMGTGRVIGVEALARWKHPRFGLMSPDQFIPLQEQIGLIEPFTMWVLREAQRQCLAWHAAGHLLAVSVNLSPQNLHSRGFADRVMGLLAETGLPPRSLKLEITENAVVMDPQRATSILTSLRTVGVQLSMDDFGTGYSSLSHLKELPVHEVKIDKSFILSMNGCDGEGAVIVKAIIDLAHNLHKNVVAEGVETEAVWKTLADLGCDAAQGYLMGRPMPADQMLTWLRTSPWGIPEGGLAQRGIA